MTQQFNNQFPTRIVVASIIWLNFCWLLLVLEERVVMQESWEEAFNFGTAPSIVSGYILITIYLLVTAYILSKNQYALSNNHLLITEHSLLGESKMDIPLSQIKNVVMQRGEGIYGWKRIAIEVNGKWHKLKCMTKKQELYQALCNQLSIHNPAS